MIKRYKEILFGLLLGLAMWVADALMHTMMPAASVEQRPELAEEMFSPDGPPLVIRLLYFSFALFTGWLLWRSNKRERASRDLESQRTTLHERVITPTTSILEECNALLRSSVLPDEALDIVRDIRSQACQIDDFAKEFPRRLLIPGQGGDTWIGPMRKFFSRVPGVVRGSEYADVALGIVYEGWGDRRRRFDRAHDRVWDYEVRVERERYTRILRAVGQCVEPDGWGEALEVGCAQGVFTAELAPHCLSLLACDVSPLACARSAERCRPYTHVRVEQSDVLQGNLPGQFDLVFVLDLLEAIHGRERVVGVADKLVNTVRPGGLLIFSGCRLPEKMRDSWWARRLMEGGDAHLACLLDRAGVRLLHQELYPEDEREIQGYPQHLIAVIQRIPASASEPDRGQ